MAFMALTLVGIRAFLPATLSAPLGFFIGALALAAFALSLLRKSVLLNTVGVFLLSFALLVRMGSMFSIPAVVLWSLWRFRETWLRMALAGGIAVLAVLMAVGTSQITAKLYGAGNELGSNFAYTLTGLSLGGQWDLAERTYRKEIDGHSEKETAGILYDKAVHNIMSHPSIFLGRLAEGEVYFWRHIFQTMLYGHLLTRTDHRGIAWLPTPIALLIFLTGTGLTLWYRTPDRDEILFAALFVASIAASVPFIMFDDGWRALMATTPFCAGILAYALRSPQPDACRKALASSLGPVRIGLLASVPTLLIAVTAGPWLFYHLQSQYREVLRHLPKIGPNALSISTNFGRTGFVVVADGDPTPSDAPAISESAFEAVLRSSGIDDAYHKVVGENVLPHPPYSVFCTTNIDLNSYGTKLLIFFGPAELVEKRGFYRVSYAPVPNGLSHGITVFNQITSVAPLEPASIGDKSGTR